MMPLDSVESLKVIKNNLWQQKLLSRSADSLLEMPNEPEILSCNETRSFRNISEKSQMFKVETDRESIEYEGSRWKSSLLERVISHRE